MAIGLVTKAIAELLDRKLNKPGTVATLRVATLPPDDDRVESVNGVNLFLYRVAESPFTKNNDWIGDRVNLRAIKRPPLSLTLQYMLTAYVQRTTNSARDDVDAQQILSKAVAILHEFPVLNDIHDSDFDSGLDTQFPAELRQVFDKIKITFLPITTDEFSKIWTGFSKAYRLSVAYEVSLLQIAPTTLAPVVGPPVQQTKLQVEKLGAPVISSVEPATGPAGSQVTIKGSGFKKTGRATIVTVGDAPSDEVEIRILTDKEIGLIIPRTLSRGPEVGIVVTSDGWSSQSAVYRVHPWIQTMLPLRGITGVPITIPLEVSAGSTIRASIDSLDAATVVDAVNKCVHVTVPRAINTNGLKSVYLIVDGKLSNARAYEVLPRILTVTKIVNSGPPKRTIITVTGERLNGASIQVRYGKWLLRGLLANDGSVTAEASDELPADQPTSVIVDGLESSVLPPRLDNIDPPQAAAGEMITLTGSGLSGEDVKVRFGKNYLTAIPQPFASRFNVTVPAELTAGQIKVSVIVHGNTTNELDFTVLL